MRGIREDVQIRLAAAYPVLVNEAPDIRSPPMLLVGAGMSIRSPPDPPVGGSAAENEDIGDCAKAVPPRVSA
jgi:hypothetical protein